MKPIIASIVAVALLVAGAPTVAAAQDYAQYTPEALQKELAKTAPSRLGVMVPMRDGAALSTDVYTPKDAKGQLPTILWKTPYNEYKLRGSTFIVQNERGRYFRKGNGKSWGTRKVGTLGCSSSAEWQLALAGMNHPAHAAMVPMSAGAGIGKMGRFQEQGNWYTGGVPRNLFFV